MATCGYICPNCNGNGYSEDGIECNWCDFHNKKDHLIREEKELQEWIEKVHQGPCCSDPGTDTNDPNPV